nr:uracil-DNA glycosylase family protein [Agrococcus sp. KRD186]
MGREVVTLADVWPQSPRAMIVGLNPAPESVQAGHYYQGRVGQRQMGRLVAAGVFDRPDGPYFESVALASHTGFTDIVKRSSRGERDVEDAEIRYGRHLLEANLNAREIPLVICVFRQPAEALLEESAAPGLQERRTAWGARVFRMPGPFDKREVVTSVMASLTRALD